jgi:hypothetical protein
MTHKVHLSRQVSSVLMMSRFQTFSRSVSDSLRNTQMKSVKTMLVLPSELLPTTPAQKVGHSDPIQCFPWSNPEGESMGNLSSALQQLRAERKQAQARVESIDQAISVIESLNGLRTFGQTNQPTRVISAASRRKMARAQRARWARAKNGSQPVAIAKTTASAPVKRTMSAAVRRKIAAFQRARWARLKAQQKKTA